MRLYGVIFSPYVQRVLIAARLKGHEIELLPPPGGLAAPEFLALSATGRIPVLDTGEARLIESGAIVEYLDEVLDGPSLLPADPAARARARAIAHVAEAELIGSLGPVLAHHVFGSAMPADALERGQGRAARAADALDRLLGEGPGPWAQGERPGLADAALVPFLNLVATLEAYPGVAALVSPRATLAGYRDRAFADPIGARCRQEVRDGFRRFMAARQGQAAQQQ